jgi:sec-independent protein translocase protein TatB
VFNLSGTEIIVILLLALVVLGPEKLPEAMRKAGRAYSELRKMANSFQSEMHSVLDEPMEELRGTADALRDATNFMGDRGTKKPASNTRTEPPASSAPPSSPAPAEPAAVSPASPESPEPAIDDLFVEDHDDEHGTAGAPVSAQDDLITRTLSGDVSPQDPPEQPGPEG